MIQARVCVAMGRWFSRVREGLGKRSRRARWKRALPVSLAAFALLPPAARPQAPAIPETPRPASGAPPKVEIAQPLLPPRALLRIGTDALLADGNIGEVAFSPDGRLIAAVCSNPPSAEVEIFEVRTGRPVKRLAAPAVRLVALRDPDVKVIAVTTDGRRIMSIGSTTKRIEETKLKIAPTKNPEMREVRFWDIQTGQRVADYRGDEECGAGRGALSRDGRHVAVSDVTWLHIFDAATGQPERTIELPGSGHGGVSGILTRRHVGRDAE